MLLWDERTPPIHFGRRHCPAPPPPHTHTPSMSACMHKEHEKPHGRTAVSPAPHCRAHTRILPSLSSPHHTTRREEEKAALKPGKVSVAFSAGGGHGRQSAGLLHAGDGEEGMHNVGPISFTGLQFGVCQTTSEGGKPNSWKTGKPSRRVLPGGGVLQPGGLCCAPRPQWHQGDGW